MSGRKFLKAIGIIPGAGIILLALLLALPAGLGHAAGDEEVARRVILFIGDGMGPAAVTAGRLFTGGSSGRLAMEQLPVTGFSRTYSSDQFVTDSAAGATALASGVKTYNSSINMTDPHTDPSGKSRPLQLLTGLARAQGKSIGIVTTSRVTHATPACFYAHGSDRNQETSIADQVGASGLSVLMGGGRGEFHSKDWRDPETGQAGLRKDGKDLAKELSGGGFTVVESAAQLKKVDLTKKDLRLLGLFDFDHMDYELDRPQDKLGDPELVEMVEAAIKVLSRNPRGYFLMVEGARIDMAAHADEARYLVNEVAALDRAVGKAVKEAGGETLIVVTADHETGGLAINGYGPREAMAGEGLLSNVTGAKTGKGVAKPRRGILSFGSGQGAPSPEAVDPANAHFKYKAAYAGGSASHTAVDVPVMAGGPGSLKFTGYQNNNEIAWKIAELMGTSFNEAANIENRNAVK